MCCAEVLGEIESRLLLSSGQIVYGNLIQASDYAIKGWLFTY